MSGIAALMSRGGGPADPTALTPMLGRMRGRGADRMDTRLAGCVALAVGRNEWELARGFHGPAMLAEDRGLILAADATLYHAADLRTQLARVGVRPSGGSASHLILAAYRAWGVDGVARLEGDFAFVLWDPRSRTLLCARDFAGMRPLHFAEAGRMLIVASTVAAVLEHPLCPRDLNVAMIGETAASLYGVPDQTCYSAVRALPAGHLATFGNGRTELRRFWDPPSITPFRKASFEEGALELGTLLESAVTERLDVEAPTSVWMSGGRDSTAVFGAGAAAIRDLRATGRLAPVSLSFPLGDPAREDEAIEAVLARWRTSSRWIDIEGVRLLDGLEERGALADDPFLYAFDPVLRALAKGSRAVGARAALTGNGGDYLFTVTDVYLSDLFYRGHWPRLAREWPLRAPHGRRPFFWWVIRPGLPAWLCTVGAALRGGRELVHPTQPPAPPWIQPHVVAAYRARTDGTSPRKGWGDSAAAEMRQALTGATLGRLHQGVGRIVLASGVELRCPLLDSRVVAFAAGRPWWERSADPDTKRLLRAAMQGVLPSEIAARRDRRAGNPGSYFDCLARDVVPRLIRARFPDSRLAELGIVNQAVLLRVAEEFARGGAREWGYHLTQTLNTELWLRGRSEAATMTASPAEERRREVVAC